MGSLSQIIIFRMNDYEVKEEILEKNDLHEHNVYAGNSKCVYSNSFCIQYQTGKKAVSYTHLTLPTNSRV